MTDSSRQPDAADGIRVIQYSLKCFAFSFGGLIPVLGVPLVMQSFSDHRKARAAGKGCWNPAKSYLVWGGIIGSVGLLVTIVGLVFFGCLLLKLLPWQYQDQ